jgi:hypothetical protein
MRDKATYAFNQKCAVQRRQHVSCCDTAGTVRCEALAKRGDEMSKGRPISIRAENHMRFALLTLGPPTDATYKIPEKQKILPIPKRTLKMIGTAENEACQISMMELSQGKWGILPPCSDHQHLTRAIVPIQCTLQARKQEWSAQHST